MLQTVTTQDGTATVAANNLNFNGYPQVVANPQIGITHASGSTFTYEDRTWQTAYVVDPSSTIGTRGTYSTIQAAITDAPSGTTIFIRPGTYTENLTLKGGQNLVTDGSADTRDTSPLVTVIGTHTIPATGANITIDGIRFDNNGNYCFTRGSGPTLTLTNCFINANNFTAINSTGGDIFFQSCTCTNEGAANNFFTVNGGTLWFDNCSLNNSGNSTVASTVQSGSVYLNDCDVDFIINPGSGGYIQAFESQFGFVYSPFRNFTWITTSGTGSEISKLFNCVFYSGTASAISVGANSTVEGYNLVVNSSNTNAITGAGTFKSNIVTFTGSSTLINTTTVTPISTGPKNTFTPTIQFGGASVGITYLAQSGIYCVVGNTLVFQIYVELTNKGSSVGNATVVGLPYNCVSPGCFGGLAASNLTFTGQINYRISSGGSSIFIDQYASGGARTQLTNTNFSNTTLLQISGSYIINT